jgi:hypothetical protein
MTLRRRDLVRLALLTGGWACGSDGQQGQQQPGPIDVEAAAVCLPDCYRAALAACQPQGQCVADPDLNGTDADGELWTCFDNGVRIHTSRRTQDGVITTNKWVESDGALCRSIESIEGPASSNFTIRNSQGQAVASAQVTSFPRMSVACGGGEVELDRQTDCGQAALLLMVPELALASACGAGSSSCKGL